jgi:pimeloyl-ACP methyl ester carboxylesterase
MTRTNRVTIASIAACVFGFAGTTRGAGQYLKVDYPASTVAGELQIAVTYTLWIPDGASRLRGVIVHQHGAGTTASIEGSTAAYDLHWQALAKKWDCALLGPSYHVLHEKNDLSPGGSELWFDPRRGSEKTFLKAIGELASKSAHPELETAPWVLWGHSGGGIWSDVMCALHPDRVVAVWMRSGSAVIGAEIVWSAEADFESGIRCFIVLRDGQELAQVPKTLVGKYGRPLFQSMTYHDTPARPLPEMRYVDDSAKPGAKHNYQVITVNSVGLKSTPSMRAQP